MLLNVRIMSVKIVLEDAVKISENCQLLCGYLLLVFAVVWSFAHLSVAFPATEIRDYQAERSLDRFEVVETFQFSGPQTGVIYRDTVTGREVLKVSAGRTSSMMEWKPGTSEKNTGVSIDDMPKKK